MGHFFFQVRSLVNDRLARLLRVPRRGVKVTPQFDSSRKASNYESKPLNRSIKHFTSSPNESQTDAQMFDEAATCVPNCNSVTASPDSSDLTSTEPVTSLQPTEMDEWRFTSLVLDRVCFWLVAAFQLISSGTMFVLSIASGR